jgi:hydrogenase maturation protease
MQENYIEKQSQKILIAGLGNLILTDDGVGVHAIRRLNHLSNEQVIVADIGTSILNSVYLIAWADKILAIDSIQYGQPPGTIYCMQLNDPEQRARLSMHDLKLWEALWMIPVEKHPSEMVLLGIEPTEITYGLELSPAVSLRLPKLVQMAETITKTWQQGNDIMNSGEILNADALGVIET